MNKPLESPLELWSKTPITATEEGNYLVTLDVFSEDFSNNYKVYDTYANLLKPNSILMQRIKLGSLFITMNDVKREFADDEAREKAAFCVFMEDVAGMVFGAHVESCVVSHREREYTFYVLKAHIKPTGPRASTLEQCFNAQSLRCYFKGRYVIDAAPPHRAYDIVAYRAYSEPIDF